MVLLQTKIYTLAQQAAARTLQIRLLHQAFILVRHQMRLDLSHKIHHHNNNNQQGSAAKLKRHIPVNNQEFRQQTDCRNIGRADQGQTT